MFKMQNRSICVGIMNQAWYNWTRRHGERNGKRKKEIIDCKWKTKPTGPGKMLHPITHFYGPKHADISVFITGVSVTATQPFWDISAPFQTHSVIKPTLCPSFSPLGRILAAQVFWKAAYVLIVGTLSWRHKWLRFPLWVSLRISFLLLFVLKLSLKEWKS